MVANYASYVKGLRSCGLQVTPAPNAAEAIRLTQKNRYDLYLVDLKLGASTGVEFIEHLFANVQNPNICVLSSYLYQRDYRVLIENFGRQIARLEKNLPSTSSPAFDAFCRRLIELAELGPSEQVTTLSRDETANLLADPFRVTYQEYQSLAADAKDKLQLAAKKIVADQLEAIWKDGDQWVLYIGGSDAPEAREIVLEKEWSDDELRDRAIELNRVPFQFRAPITNDDFGCSGPRNQATYPTVTFSIRRPAGTKSFSAHFDTGCYENYLSLETWLDLTGDPELGFYRVRDYRGQTLITYEKRLELRIVDQQNANRHKAVDVNVVLVKDWLGSRFIATCPLECAAKDRAQAGDGFNCHKRTGLIGRRLLLDNELTMTLAPPNITTRLS